MPRSSPRFSRLIACALLAVSALTACNSKVEDTRPGQPVKHRQEAFKALLRAFEPVGIMLSDGKYEAEYLAKLNAALTQVRETPWHYFGPDTDYPPSKSRPEVWSQPEKFEAERVGFLTALDALQTADSLEAVQTAYNEARTRCKSCHNSFRH
jgi:cytochrome c556